MSHHGSYLELVWILLGFKVVITVKREKIKCSYFHLSLIESCCKLRLASVVYTTGFRWDWHQILNNPKLGIGKKPSLSVKVGWTKKSLRFVKDGQAQVLSHYSRVSKLLHLEQGRMQLAKLRQQTLVFKISLPYSLLIIVIYFFKHLLTTCIHYLDFVRWYNCF